jgi:hypothetical protein
MQGLRRAHASRTCVSTRLMRTAIPRLCLRRTVALRCVYVQVALHQAEALRVVYRRHQAAPQLLLPTRSQCAHARISHACIQNIASMHGIETKSVSTCHISGTLWCAHMRADKMRGGTNMLAKARMRGGSGTRNHGMFLTHAYVLITH